MESKKYKITVFSDSHGNVNAFKKAMPIINSSDYFVYLGDGNRDLDKVLPEITAEVIRVKGNCDVMSEHPQDAVLTVGETKFMITHGNAYGVKSSTIGLAAHARETGCGWALYGHTHRAQVFDAGGVMLLNPGSAGYGKPTCAVIEGDGKFFTAEIISL